MAPKLKMNDEVVLLLIKEVKSRGYLWNIDDKNYNDRFLCLSAWRDICKTLEYPEDVVKTKWKNLRDLFKREQKKFKVHSLEEYTGRWRHFRILWFLHNPKDIVSNDNEDDEEVDYTVSEFETAETFVKFEPSDRNDIEVYLDDPVDPIPDKRRKYNDDDYDLMYLKSLAPYFSQLDPMRKLVVRSKIQDMLMNEIAAQNSTVRPNKRNYLE